MSQHSDTIEPSLHKTATNITLSPELFEKLYLTPKVPHVGDAYKRYANPTPMGFVGFVISTFSFAMVMMGWGGAAGLSVVVGKAHALCGKLVEVWRVVAQQHR